jgi:hypothetical protein
MSDFILLALSTLVGVLFVAANMLTGSHSVADWAVLIGFPSGLLATGIAWYTALVGAAITSFTRTFDFLAAIAVSVTAFFAAYATPLWLVLPIVGVLLGAGTLRGLSRVEPWPPCLSSSSCWWASSRPRSTPTPRARLARLCGIRAASCWRLSYLSGQMMFGSAASNRSPDCRLWSSSPSREIFCELFGLQLARGS